MRNLYPRLAATNLKKNRRFYLPYLLACIVIVALFCIILTLASDPYLGQMQHGGSVSQVLGFGVSIMALFSAIILFYTNSTFTKQRKREFAIYNILGMEKRHISYVLFWESLYTAAMALFFGLVAAGVFSKLLQLVLVRLIGGEATFGLNIRLWSIGCTVVFFGALFLLLLLNTIRIIHLSNPVQLLRAGSEGEREPRSKTPILTSTAAPAACSITHTSSTSPARTTSSSTRCTRFSATPSLSPLPWRRT